MLVKINIINKIVTILVKDDGIGFNQKKMRGINPFENKFGLVLIRERAKSLNGKLEISSKRNLGTEILVKVPLSVF